MSEDNLINITCPKLKVGKFHGMNYSCGRIAVRVSPNSYGEAFCTRCKEHFYFEVNSDGVPGPQPKRVSVAKG